MSIPTDSYQSEYSGEEIDECLGWTKEIYEFLHPPAEEGCRFLVLEEGAQQPSWMLIQNITSEGVEF